MNELHNISVLVTRPLPQGAFLVNGLKAAGAVPYYLPTVDIISLTDTPAFLAAVRALDSCDWVIFNSPQAAYHAVPVMKALWPVWPKKVKIATIGGGTAEVLNSLQLPVNTFPEQRWESEGLLALSEFQNVQGLTIGIVRGQGGRKLLTETLEARGAQVLPMIAYQRTLPKTDVSAYLQLINQQKIDIIVTTSQEILQNLMYLLGDTTLLLHIPLIVVSERMFTFAREAGFQTILLAHDAGLTAVIATIKEHVCRMKMNKI